MKTSAQSVVDGYEDNGLDALHYEEKNKILWLVQSKWISKADTLHENENDHL